MPAITTPRMLLLDAAFTADALIAVGERGTILRSTDQAATFQPIASPTPTTLTAVSFAPASSLGWAVGHDALILATTDAGKTWSRQYQGENIQDSFLDVLALDAQRVLAVGAYGLCVVTIDAGKTWARRKLSDDDYHLNRLSRGPTGTLYLAGEHGTLLRSTDAGATWSKIPTPYEGSFYGILPLTERAILAYGLRGHAYRSIDDGATWTQIPTPSPVLLATAAQLGPD
ncbi:MAG: YCF48-related protein, partial [Verrucomicrobiota bacterium]